MTYWWLFIVSAAVSTSVFGIALLHHQKRITFWTYLQFAAEVVSHCQELTFNEANCSEMFWLDISLCCCCR